MVATGSFRKRPCPIEGVLPRRRCLLPSSPSFLSSLLPYLPTVSFPLETLCFLLTLSLCAIFCFRIIINILPDMLFPRCLFCIPPTALVFERPAWWPQCCK
ncbi:hypothetical protein Naga_102367g1 [Nannochloropsis gaditana]|uniref:Uncharacterized protein n=1 Tax=Nannochloropsis gaditana TaxID=72520 RepID=W7T6X7_9STRA|nr:hypothetical protein Naga_102367g1 [Nannochloropsis gaditana]